MIAAACFGFFMLTIGAAMCNELRPSYAFRRSVAQYPMFTVIAGLFLWLGLVFLAIAAVVAICASHPFC